MAASIATLQKRLHSRRDPTRQNAAEQLTERYAEDDECALILPLLEHEDPVIRDGALLGLRDAGFPDSGSEPDYALLLPQVIALAKQETSLCTTILGQAALAGTDISAAIPTLVALLANKNATCDHEAIAETLRYAQLNGADASAAFETLAQRFAAVGRKGNDRGEMAAFADALSEGASNGADISVAVPYLRKYLTDESVTALVFHHLNREEWAEVLALLRTRRGDETGKKVWTALGRARRLGTDITPVMMQVAELISGGKRMGAKTAVNLMRSAAYYGDPTPLLATLEPFLNHRTRDIRWRAADTFRVAASRGFDIDPALPALEERLHRATKAKDWTTVADAGAALLLASVFAQRWPELEERLAGAETMVIQELSNSLVNAFYGEVEVPPELLSVLSPLLEHESSYVCNAVTSVFGAAASHDLEVEDAIPSLVELLFTKQKIDAHWAQRTLERMSEKRGNAERCLEALEDRGLERAPAAVQLLAERLREQLNEK